MNGETRPRVRLGRGDFMGDVCAKPEAETLRTLERGLNGIGWNEGGVLE